MTTDSYPRYVVGSAERGGVRPHHIVLLTEPLPAEVVPGVSLTQSPSGVARVALCGAAVRTKGADSWPPAAERSSWWQRYTHAKCIALWSKATGQAFEPLPAEPEPATAAVRPDHVTLRVDQDPDWRRDIQTWPPPPGPVIVPSQSWSAPSEAQVPRYRLLWREVLPYHWIVQSNPPGTDTSELFVVPNIQGGWQQRRPYLGTIFGVERAEPQAAILPHILAFLGVEQGGA